MMVLSNLLAGDDEQEQQPQSRQTQGDHRRDSH